MADLKRTPIDPDDFAWGDICDIYGNPFRIGDQMKLVDWTGGAMPNFDSELGSTTLLYFEVPPDSETETEYVTGRPKEPHESGGGWTHYKLRELYEHLGVRVPPGEVLRMIDAYVAVIDREPGEWVGKARDLIDSLTGPDDSWTDA